MREEPATAWRLGVILVVFRTARGLMVVRNQAGRILLTKSALFLRNWVQTV